jgi:hypothetical protein
MTGCAGAWSVDPRTCHVPITRAQWLAIPFRFILIPVLDGPVLVFSTEDQPRASVYNAELDQWREAWPRAKRNPQAARRIARAVRKAHMWRVNHALGYTYPGNPPGYIEFAADAITR